MKAKLILPLVLLAFLGAISVVPVHAADFGGLYEIESIFTGLLPVFIALGALGLIIWALKEVLPGKKYINL